MPIRFESWSASYKGPNELPIKTWIHDAYVYTDTLLPGPNTDLWHPILLPENRPDKFPTTRAGYAMKTHLLVRDQSVLLISPSKEDPKPESIEIPHLYIQNVRPLEIVVFHDKDWHYGFLIYEAPKTISTAVVSKDKR